MVTGSWSPGSGLGGPGLPETSGMRGVTPGKGLRVAHCWIQGRLTKWPQAKAKMTPEHALPVGRSPQPLGGPSSVPVSPASSKKCRGPSHPSKSPGSHRAPLPWGTVPWLLTKDALCTPTALLGGCCPGCSEGTGWGSWVRCAHPLLLGAVHFGFIIHPAGPRQQPEPFSASA